MRESTNLMGKDQDNCVGSKFAIQTRHILIFLAQEFFLFIKKMQLHNSKTFLTSLPLKLDLN